MKKIKLAFAVSPLVIILISPFYGAFLSYYYGFGEFSLSGAIMYAQMAAVVGVLAGYLFLFTYGLAVWFALKKLNKQFLISYLVLGSIPGLVYGLGHPMWVEGYLPGVLFGSAIASAFWFVGVRGNASNN